MEHIQRPKKTFLRTAMAPPSGLSSLRRRPAVDPVSRLVLAAVRVTDPEPCREDEGESEGEDEDEGDQAVEVTGDGSAADRQNFRLQESIFPVSCAALSLTRSFHVPSAVSEEASTEYVVLMLSALPPVP